MSSLDIMATATKKFTDKEIGLTTSKTFRFAVEIHTDRGNFSAKDRVFLKDLAIFRDYEDNFADLIEISLMIPLGTLLYDIYDQSDNLEITVKKFTQFYTALGPKSESAPHVYTERYKAVYLSDKNQALPTTRSSTRDDLNQRMPVAVVFQLIHKSAEAIRLKTTDGVFSGSGKKISAEQLLRNILSTEVEKIRIDNRPPVDMVSIKTPDSKELFASVIVPESKRVVEVPDFLQEKLNGVYNDGMGFYVQPYMTKPGEYKTCLSVFNLYNPDCDESSDSVIYCLNSSSDAYNFVGGIHDPSGKGTHILAHSLTKLDDTKQTKSLNQGTGFRVTDASKMMDAPVKYEKAGAKFDRKNTSTEVVGQARDDGWNFAPHRGIGSNNLALATDVYRRAGVYATLQCSNLDHDLVLPGKKYDIHYITNQVGEDGKSTKIMGKRTGYVLQALTAYTNPSPNLIMNSNSAYVEMSSHTTFKVIVGQLQTPE